MSFEELLEEYISGHSDKERYIRTVAGIFIERGIKQPTENDYKEYLKVGLQEKGIKGETAYYRYKNAGKDFYEWLSTKGDKTMDIPLETETKTEGMSAVSEITSVESETATDKSTENEPVIESEATSDTDMANSKDTLNSEDTIKSKNASRKTGKNGKEQISLYVDSGIYAKLKEIAQYKKMTVSDILCTAMKNIVDKNFEKIQRIRQAIESENLEI